MTCAAWIRDKGDEPAVLECCCKVLIVSKGAKMSFEQPAASALAKLFLIPLTHAASALDSGLDTFVSIVLTTGLIVEIARRRLCN